MKSQPERAWIIGVERLQHLRIWRRQLSRYRQRPLPNRVQEFSEYGGPFPARPSGTESLRPRGCHLGLPDTHPMRSESSVFKEHSRAEAALVERKVEQRHKRLTIT
jgi:hypothetical protein